MDAQVGGIVKIARGTGSEAQVGGIVKIARGTGSEAQVGGIVKIVRAREFPGILIAGIVKIVRARPEDCLVRAPLAAHFGPRGAHSVPGGDAY